jgi:ion channel
MEWHAGGLLRRLQASHSYGFVLVLVLALFGFVAAAPDEAWPRAVVVILLACTLAVALWTSAVPGRIDAAAVVLVAIGAAAATLILLTDSSNAIGILWLLDVLLIAATCAVIVRGIRDVRGVNVQSVLGALCIYLLIGLLYTFVYGAIAALESGPFFAQGTEGTSSIRLYFSAITLAAVGYGDYTANTDLGRTVAASEGLLGQVYLVTVVAVIISRLRPAHPQRANGQ